MRTSQNLKNNNLITNNHNNPNNPQRRNPKLKIKLTTKKINNKPKSSRSIPKNISVVDSPIWKPSRVGSSLKSSKKRNSNLTQLGTHSIWETIKVNNKSKLNNKNRNPSNKHSNKLPNNKKFLNKQSNKNKRTRRKIN